MASIRHMKQKASGLDVGPETSNIRTPLKRDEPSYLHLIKEIISQQSILENWDKVQILHSHIEDSNLFKGLPCHHKYHFEYCWESVEEISEELGPVKTAKAYYRQLIKDPDSHIKEFWCYDSFNEKERREDEKNDILEGLRVFLTGCRSKGHFFDILNNPHWYQDDTIEGDNELKKRLKILGSELTEQILRFTRLLEDKQPNSYTKRQLSEHFKQMTNLVENDSKTQQKIFGS